MTREILLIKELGIINKIKGRNETARNRWGEGKNNHIEIIEIIIYVL